jgi:hypothetical protein
MTNSSDFLANGKATLTLQGAPVTGAGRTSYSSGGVIVALNSYDWTDTPANSPGDVCQAFVFAPGGGADYSGSITLEVWPAAALSPSHASGSPETKVTLTGSGFASDDTVEIFAGHIGTPRFLATTIAGASGAFVVEGRVPQNPYGPTDVYAVGVSSRKLGAATLFVTPELAANPASGAPGGSTTAYGFGFGAGETVDIYVNNPQQLLGTATTDGAGSGALTITIPANAPPGINAVIGWGRRQRPSDWARSWWNDIAARRATVI